MKKLLVPLALAMALLVGTGPVRASPATLVVDYDGFASTTDCEDTATAAFTTINLALGVATAGDTILVCPGIYTEQVTITQNNLTLAGAGPGATVAAPTAMADPKAIVRVNGATGVTIDGLTIAGPGGGSCGSLRYGIRVDGGGSATITNNHITSIRDTPFGGCQNGVGILVGRAFESTTGSATIANNLIDDYQKGGIVVDNTDSSATISGNTVTGVGKTPTIAQNGIQVSRGATAEIRGNAISENFYTGCSNQDAAKTGCTPFVSAALLLFDVSANAVKHSDNMFRGNQFNVLLVNSQSL